MRPKSDVGRWLLVFLWAAVIFVFSSIPQTKVSQFFLTDFIIKKIAHISEYAILYALIYKATRGKWVASFVLTIIYAITDEIHQSFVPGRTPRIYDVIGFDLTGANIATYSIWKLKQFRKNRQNK
jgi:VanZ family protein